MPHLRIVVDNVALVSGLEPDWGFAAVVSGCEKGLLFDTGPDGKKLLSNMEALGMDPLMIDIIVISHTHADHAGGLLGFLSVNADVEVFVPDGLSPDTVRAVENLGATPIIVGPPGEMLSGVLTTGAMGSGELEQGLILAGHGGATLVTGCAHPGIIPMIKEAGRQAGGPIELVVGGLHLRRKPKKEVREIAEKMRKLGVRRVAPSHCTGEESVSVMADVFGEGFIESGLGKTISIS